MSAGARGTLLALSVAALALLAGCPNKDRSSAASPGSASARGSAAAGSAASSASRVCANLASQFRKLLASGGACARDDQCTCTGRGPLGCGGATDVRTARRLQTMRRLFALASCPVTRRCAAKSRCATARCVAKRCVAVARG
jgi:hypothetical protein